MIFCFKLTTRKTLAILPKRISIGQELDAGGLNIEVY